MPPLVLAAALVAAQPTVYPAPNVPTIPDQPELTRQIAARDAEFFALFFTGRCEVERFRAMLADDVEFYHDRGGFNVRSAEDFVAIFRENCAQREDPRAWRSRRVLVPESLHVDPVPGWGAIETGEHLFYEREGVECEERLAGRARFAQLWVLGGDGQWRISRVFSYAHAPAGAEAAAATQRR
ncbi:MAG TPA: nuclear transport factor 2 family protein [Allosphingosinicella sp.]|jgi:hypothetical protein